MLGSVLSQQAQYEDSIHVKPRGDVLSDAVQLRDPILEAQVRERASPERCLRSGETGQPRWRGLRAAATLFRSHGPETSIFA